jgi:hypothetical protein
MALHQRGDEQLNVDLPARPYADIPDEDKPKLDALLWRWTDRQCRRNGL